MVTDVIFLKQLIIACFSLFGILFLMLGIISIFFMQSGSNNVRLLACICLLGGLSILSQMGRLFASAFSSENYSLGENFVMLLCLMYLYFELLKKLYPNLNHRKYVMFLRFFPFILIILWIITEFLTGSKMLFCVGLYLLIFSGVVFVSLLVWSKLRQLKKQQSSNIQEIRLIRVETVVYAVYGSLFCLSLLQEKLSGRFALCLLLLSIPLITARYLGFYFRKVVLHGSDEASENEKQLNDYDEEDNHLLDSGHRADTRHRRRLLALEKNFLNLLENEKIYLDTELTLEKVAQELRTNKTYLSKVLNNELNKNFYQLINEYRIKNAMEMMLKPESDNVTIKYISEMSGFKSISSFNKSFKQINGISPREWSKGN